MGLAQSPVPALALAIVISSSVVACGDGNVKDHPNVILILIDALRADYLGSYGFDGDTSPYLDRLAAESVLFERCYSQAPSTLPSVASLFTTLHPVQHGVVTRPPPILDRSPEPRDPSFNAIPQHAMTLAEELSRVGYSTGAFVANPWLSSVFGFDRGFMVYDDRMADVLTSAATVVDAASIWLHSEMVTEPFFLYLHLMDVHGPYVAPHSDVEAVRACPGFGQDRALTANEVRRIPAYLLETSWGTGAKRSRLLEWRIRYGAGVHVVDRQLRDFDQWMRSTGVLDSSLLIVTSDHGEELCEHGGWNHGQNLYDHEIHVPLIIRYPGADHRRGVRIPQVVSLTDVAATIFEAIGVDRPPGMGGRDLAILLSETDDPPHSGETFAAGMRNRPAQHAVFDGRFKLIVDLASGTAELYDHDVDPAEHHNIAGQDPGSLHRLEKLLFEKLSEMGPSETGDTIQLPKDVMDRLRSFGYLDSPDALSQAR